MVEWCGRPGEPTSYAMLGIHEGPPTAVEFLAGQPFEGALVGRFDQVTFGLADEYRDAVASSFPSDGVVQPCLAGHGRLGSSIVAFWAVSFFALDYHDDMWSAPDDAVWNMWLRAFRAARLRAEQRRLGKQIELHLASPFPASVDRGSLYGDLEPVMAGSDIYGWALQAASGDALSDEDILGIEQVRQSILDSFGVLPAEARDYFKDVRNLALTVLSVARLLGESP